MGLNWVEDIVAHSYRARGFMVIQNEDLVMPRTPKRRIRGHSDIDILAIKGSEIVHIECQSWWGPAKDNEEREFQRLKDRFENAPKVIFDKYNFLDPKKFRLSRVFVTSGKPKKGSGDGPWNRLTQFCEKHDIKLLEIDTVISDLASQLKKKYPKSDRVGKEPPLARFLLHLIHSGFLKETSGVEESESVGIVTTEQSTGADS